jgi:hypothetical protein
MAANRAHLENEVYLRMNVAEYLNDHHLDEQILRQRVASLVDSFLKSLQEGPQIFVSYIEDITLERIEEGIALHELQLSLQVLEEKAWTAVVESIPLTEQVPCLSQITLTIGTAKDHIAHIYLQHLEKAEAALILMQQNEGLALSEDVNWQRGTVHPHHEMA